MSWLDTVGFERRPVVFVEDHLYHTSEWLAACAASDPDLLSLLTVCAIDRSGPDTEAAITEWLARYPALQVAALTGLTDDRLRPLGTRDLESVPAFGALLASLLRPGGVLVQDVHLSTLPCVAADRWWQSIFVATHVRGLQADRPPAVRFVSNKRGYAATFGRDLAEAGFDPRDVIDKAEVVSVGVPVLRALVDQRFDCALSLRRPPQPRRVHRVSPTDRDAIESALDLVLWPGTEGPGSADLGGRLVGRRLVLRAGSHETDTWAHLLADGLAGGPGLPVVSVGERVGPASAARAELTNVAARHIHTLRSRLNDGAAIVTSRHAYRLADALAIGQVDRLTLRRPST
jgi:hypothetical protein